VLKVRVRPATFDRFTTTSGVRQWCILARALFCHPINWIMEHMSGIKSVTLGRCTVTDLDCADDTAPPASQLPDLETFLSAILSGCPNPGLKCVLALDECAVF